MLYYPKKIQIIKVWRWSQALSYEKKGTKKGDRPQKQKKGTDLKKLRKRKKGPDPKKRLLLRFFLIIMFREKRGIDK